jgi:hypothetical protein
MIFKTSPARQTMRREMLLGKPRRTGVLEKRDFVVKKLVVSGQTRRVTILSPNLERG